jgi:hypothetical protein
MKNKPKCCNEQELIPFSFRSTNLLRCNSCSELYINPKEEKRKCNFCKEKKLTTIWGNKNIYICKECWDEIHDYDYELYKNLFKESFKTIKKCIGCDNK